MQQSELFSILDTVESTNNYAMAQVYAGLATHGQAWFAKEQWGGKGQRGKKWLSTTGENIIMSIVLKPDAAFKDKPFYLSALVACVCRYFFAQLSNEIVQIKWPNDIYFRDRKAGGILIENNFSGKGWQWAIIGIGININQTHFDSDVTNPTSLKTITQKMYDPIVLAKQLQQVLLQKIANCTKNSLQPILDEYNIHLYKKEEMVFLKKENAVFETKIKSVDEYGQLLTENVLERKFAVGEVEWVR
jgi:BirA family transcriptional regulator, biotin operon repressor / biotin---[acetyl-CoA-carboxylase] ligase